jgi:DNA polymerase III subunit delta
MSYRNFLDEIKKGMPSANYVLAASDPFLHSEAVSLIRDLVPVHERDFNFHIFDLLNAQVDSLPFEHILDIVNTVPFFSGRKFVVVENFQKIPKKDLKKLDQYLINPSERSALILLNAGPVKKEVKDNLKGLKQIILDISAREILPWIKAKAKSKGIELSDGAADYLLAMIGTDLGLLSSELVKYGLIGKPHIEKKDIIEIVEARRTYTAFDLVEAIRMKDTERVFKVYRALRDSEESYSLLGALNWQYGRSFAGKNTSKDRDYYNRVFELLNRADLGIKSSGGLYPMELLLVELLKLSKQR